MSSRAFSKGKHLGIEIAWGYSLGYVSIQNIVVSLHLSLALFHTWHATRFVSRERVARDVEKFRSSNLSMFTNAAKAGKLL